MLVSVEHLSKMRNVRAIVDDVSFAIEEKDRIALVGVNGTGKSTLLRVIAGKEKADSGTITYRRELRISMLDQDPVFDASSTVLDAVLAGADDVSAYEARSILNRLGMRDMEAEIGILSGGQKKRVALARALLRPCDLLILDEPSNGIDPRGFEAIRSLLIRLNREQGKTIFISSHQLEELSKLATSYGFMKNGRIVEQLSRAELEDKSKDYLLLRTADSRQAAVCLEELLHIRNYRILNRSDIQITEETDSAALIALLVKHDVPILECSWHHQSLEQYFFHKNGGERDVESV